MTYQKNPAEWRETTRICRSCGEWKPFAEFAVERAVCRLCKNRGDAERKRRRKAEKRAAREQWRRETFRGNHRKCSKCHQWHPTESYKGRGICRSCDNKRQRDKYRNASPERQQQIIDDAVRRRRKSIQKRVRSQIEEARSAIRILQSHHLSLAAIYRLTGVTPGTVREIMAGDRKYIHQQTVDNLYEGLTHLIQTGQRPS